MSEAKLVITEIDDLSASGECSLCGALLITMGSNRGAALAKLRDMFAAHADHCSKRGVNPPAIPEAHES